MKGKTKIADIMLPASSQGSRGEREGQDEIFIKDWPFSFVALTGGGLADDVHANIGHKIGQLEGNADPKRLVTPNMYLTGGSLGARRLGILLVEDKKELGREWLITYEESLLKEDNGGN